jgi:hypothetical protein
MVKAAELLKGTSALMTSAVALTIVPTSGPPKVTVVDSGVNLVVAVALSVSASPPLGVALETVPANVVGRTATTVVSDLSPGELVRMHVELRPTPAMVSCAEVWGPGNGVGVTVAVLASQEVKEMFATSGVKRLSTTFALIAAEVPIFITSARRSTMIRLGVPTPDAVGSLLQPTIPPATRPANPSTTDIRVFMHTST